MAGTGTFPRLPTLFGVSLPHAPERVPVRGLSRSVFAQHTRITMWKKIKAHPVWLLTALVLLALAGWLIYAKWIAKPPPPPLITTPVERGDIEDSVLASGTIQAARLVNVGSQASGQVKKLYVKLGDVVQPGQHIADIDATTQQNSLKDAQAALTSARAQRGAKQAALVKAQAEMARQSYMYERDAASKADFQAAQQALAAAQADLKAADAQIAQYAVRAQTAQANLGYTRISSPTAGTVVAIVTEEGQTVNANQTAPTIVKVAQLDTMTIQAQISEADVPRVRPGLPAYFTILGEPERRYPARLSSIEPGPTEMKTYDGTATTSNSSNAIYYNGLLDAPNPDGKLRIQMTAQVTIVLNEARNTLIIPSGALIAQRSARRGASAASGAVRGSSAAPAASAAFGSATVPASDASAAAPASAPQPGASAARDGTRNRDGGNGRWYTVRVAKGDKGQQTVEERRVRIGLNNRVQAQVLEGLSEGEQVVVGDASGDKASGRQRGVRMF